MTELKNFITSHLFIADDELELILSHFKEREIVKDTLLLRQGHIARDYIFVKKGALRVFFNHADQEVTGWVALENEFLCDLISLKSQVPSFMNMQALEDSTVCTISYSHMEMLYARFPDWQKFGRLLWERAFMRVLEGVIMFQTQSAEERYKNTLRQSELIQRVPLKHLSSFLGITPSSLSRLRKKKG